LSAPGDPGAIRAFACLDGFEDLVLTEVARLAPGAAPVERVPGLAAARDPAADPALALLPPLEPAFARAEFALWERVRAPDPRTLAERLAAPLAEAIDPAGAPPALHVFAASMEGREERVRAAKGIEAALRRALGGRVSARIAAAPGDEVLDVAVVGAREAWLGAHRRTPAMSAYPGGQRRLAARPEAPARSHLKLEEALEWSALPIAPGDVAIDVGCAPGGWSYVLLERGLVVHGVDPTPVAEAVRVHPGFHHHRGSAKRLRPERDAPGARWLFCDMNGPPAAALGILERLLRDAPAIEGILHTLKLSDDPPLETLDAARAFFRVAGFASVRARHLYHNRRELTLLARRG
jgi:23S rRNA (cytidine2498-2'-O)-methyltransferase